MRKYQILISLLAIFMFLFVTGSELFAQKTIWVKGYYRDNGTYVQGYYKTAPDGNPYNNFSYPGNYNPYTGKTATGNPETYLRNYYKKSLSKSSKPLGYLSKKYYRDYDAIINSELSNSWNNIYNTDGESGLNFENGYNYLLPALNSNNSLLPALNKNNSLSEPLYQENYLLPPLYDE